MAAMKSRYLVNVLRMQPLGGTVAVCTDRISGFLATFGSNNSLQAAHRYVPVHGGSRHMVVGS